MLISSASWTALVRLAAVMGTVTVAGYLVAIKIFMFVILPAWGLSNSAATLVGQNLGAGKPNRAEQSVYKTGLYATWYMGALAAVCLLFTNQICGFFTDDPAVRATAVTCLRCISVGNICYAWGMVLVQAFNGAGDTRTPLMINIFCYWCFQIPLAWTLSVPLHAGPIGIFIAVPATETLATISSFILFRQGKWKLKVI